MNSVACIVDIAYKEHPDSIAFVDKKGTVDYKILYKDARRIGCAIIEKGLFKRPIAVFMDEDILSIKVIFGISYSGNYYCFLDPNAQASRVNTILNSFSPEMIIVDDRHLKIVKELVTGGSQYKIITANELIDGDVNNEIIDRIQNQIIDTDIFSVIYTSGSTGEPKGTIMTHAALIDMVEQNAEYYGLSSEMILANQNPFCFLGSYVDIFPTVYVCCTNFITPREYFSKPDSLARFIIDNKIDVLNYSYSALTLMVGYKLFQNYDFCNLKKIITGGGLMIGKTVNAIMSGLPNLEIYNTYGSSECMCRYHYLVNRHFEDDEAIPAGFPYRNTRAVILNDGKPVQNGESGELYIAGLKGVMGYYRDKELTRSVFIDNPANDEYCELVYKTGDIAAINDYGELIILGRTDNQFKHNGYRVNATEIERCAASLSEVDEVCVLFDAKAEKIWLFYSGVAENKEVRRRIHKELPSYMMPEEFIKLDILPRNTNAKIDRMKLKSLMK